MNEPSEIERLYRELVHSIGPEEEHPPSNYRRRDERPLQELVEEVRRLAATNPLAESSTLEQPAPALPKPGEQDHSIQRAAAHLQASSAQDAAGPIEHPEPFVGPGADPPLLSRAPRIRPLWWMAISALLILLVAGSAIAFMLQGTPDKTNRATAPVPSATKESPGRELAATPVAPEKTPEPPLAVPTNPETTADTASPSPDLLRNQQQPSEPPAATQEPRSLEVSGGITAPAGVAAAATAATPPLDRPNKAKRLKKRRRAPVEVRPR